MPIDIGTVSDPEFVAAMPLTPCKKSGTIVIAPNIPAPVIIVAIAATVNVRFLNRCGGSIGSDALSSASMKSTSITPATPKSESSSIESQA